MLDIEKEMTILLDKKSSYGDYDYNPWADLVRRVAAERDTYRKFCSEFVSDKPDKVYLKWLDAEVNWDIAWRKRRNNAIHRS